MNIEESLFIPLVVALVEFAKKMGLPNFWAPLLAIALGISLSLSSGIIIFETIMNGLVIGLAAAGLYSSGKRIIGK